uniref:Uncharacterized protein n=1 Tax=Oryza barthii TaxID=65489 RepID=A0A0D3GQ68_9ORYZ
MDELDDMATTFRRWSDDLTPDLVSRVADCCPVKDYASCRAVCRAWRSALPSLASRPLAPVAAADAGVAVSLGVCSQNARRWSRLVGLHQPSGLDAETCCCVGGTRDGWLALVGAAAGKPASGAVLLFNPLTGAEIPLHASLYDPECERAPKVVFSPSPTARDFAAVSMCRPNRLAVQRATEGYSSSLVVDIEALMDGAVVADIAYSEEGKAKVVYCLTTHGAVHRLLRVSESEVFVLRYDPGARGPLWVEVKDLGGHAVFLGANDAAVRVVVDSSELVGDCLYYWDNTAAPEGGYEAFVFNVASRGSARRLPVAGGVSSPLWYFLPAWEKTNLKKPVQYDDSLPVQYDDEPDIGA